MSDRIDELKAKVDRLSDELGDAKQQLKAALDDLAPFKVGDVVQATDRREGGWQPAIVRSVEHTDFGRGPIFWFRVSFRKKDGDWSVRDMYVGDKVRLLPDSAEREGAVSDV